MSDQQAPPNGDSPAVAGPDEAPGTAQDQQSQDTPGHGQDVNWEQRYKDTQADYTRQQQELAQLKHEREWAQVALTSDDPDIQRQAFEILGIEVEEPEEGYEDFEEFTQEDPYDQRIRALEEQLSVREQQAQAQQEQQLLLTDAETQFEQLGMPWTEDPLEQETRQIIFERALSLPRLPPKPGQPREGLLDIQTAHEQFRTWEDNRMKSWAKTKRAPYVSPGGLPANEVPNPGHGQQARLNRAMLSLRNNMGDNE